MFTVSAAIICNQLYSCTTLHSQLTFPPRNFEPCTGPDDCFDLDGIGCTCYQRASGCDDGYGACFPSTDNGFQSGSEPCTDDSECSGLAECVNDAGGSYCYSPFPACSGGASGRRMFEKKDAAGSGIGMRYPKRKSELTSPYRRGFQAH